MSQPPELEKPWVKAQSSDAIYCYYNELPENIKANLKQQSGAKFSDDKFHYSVKDYGNGNVKVFRNPKGKPNHNTAELIAALNKNTGIMEQILAEFRTQTLLLDKVREYTEIVAKAQPHFKPATSIPASQGAGGSTQA